MECPTCRGTGQIKATLGIKLKAFRQAKHASVEDAARAVGVSPTQISALENDNAKNPGLKTVAALAKYYNTTVDDLIKENGD